jgi:hypothetical protein
MANYSADAALLNAVPKAIHAGIQCEMGKITSTAALSVGDVFNMVKMPRGARIVDIQVQGAVVGTSAGFGVGDPGSTTRHGKVSIHTAGATVRPSSLQLNAGAGSIADDAKEWMLTLNVTEVTSNSGGVSMNLLVHYRMDGDPY